MTTKLLDFEERALAQSSLYKTFSLTVLSIHHSSHHHEHPAQ